MKVWAGAMGGMVLGGGIGWFLPGLLIAQPHEFEALGLLVLQSLGLAVGATAGFVAGGVLAGRFSDRSRRDRERHE
jgi:hypothetical protein